MRGSLPFSPHGPAAVAAVAGLSPEMPVALVRHADPRPTQEDGLEGTSNTTFLPGALTWLLQSRVKGVGEDFRLTGTVSLGRGGPGVGFLRFEPGLIALRTLGPDPHAPGKDRLIVTGKDERLARRQIPGEI